MKNRIIAIIPARYHASRLPGKPLADIAGKPMIQHVYERASRARVDDVVVATDDARIVEVVRGFGGQVVMTSSDHPSGTDRVAEVARALNAEIVVNVQGDEPLLDPELINLAAAPLWADPNIVMSTLAHPLTDPADAVDPNVVKVVCNRAGFALYFSRAAIPHDRDGDNPGSPQGLLRHVGLYLYRADFLQRFSQLQPTRLERYERLEQLRALEHGYPIRVVVAPGEVMR